MKSKNGNLNISEVSCIKDAKIDELSKIKALALQLKEQQIKLLAKTNSEIRKKNIYAIH